MEAAKPPPAGDSSAGAGIIAALLARHGQDMKRLGLADNSGAAAELASDAAPAEGTYNHLSERARELVRQIQAADMNSIAGLRGPAGGRLVAQRGPQAYQHGSNITEADETVHGSRVFPSGPDQGRLSLNDIYLRMAAEEGRAGGQDGGGVRYYISNVDDAMDQENNRMKSDAEAEIDRLIAEAAAGPSMPAVDQHHHMPSSRLLRRIRISDKELYFSHLWTLAQQTAQ